MVKRKPLRYRAGQLRQVSVSVGVDFTGIHFVGCNVNRRHTMGNLTGRADGVQRGAALSYGCMSFFLPQFVGIEPILGFPLVRKII